MLIEAEHDPLEILAVDRSGQDSVRCMSIFDLRPSAPTLTSSRIFAPAGPDGVPHSNR